MNATTKLKEEIENFAEYLKENNSFYKAVYKGELDLETLSLFTANLRYLVEHTPIHLGLACNVSNLKGMTEHYNFFKEKIGEEEGHDQWADDDLKRQRELGANQSSIRILKSMRDLAKNNADTINRDPNLYLPYILLAEYFTVIATPPMLEALESKNRIPQNTLSVMGKHAELDKHHINEWEEEVSKFVDIEANFEDYLAMIKKANQLYDIFCNECMEVASGRKVA